MTKFVNFYRMFLVIFGSLIGFLLFSVVLILSGNFALALTISLVGFSLPIMVVLDNLNLKHSAK